MVGRRCGPGVFWLFCGSGNTDVGLLCEYRGASSFRVVIPGRMERNPSGV